MKKILMMFLLLVISIYANDVELNTSEKQLLLEWTNTNCHENHKSYDNLSKDRYFSCEFRRNEKNERLNYRFLLY